MKHMLAVLLLCLFPASPHAKKTATPDKPTLTVIGFTNELEDSSWRDARIGLGLRTMLAEQLFASGEFALVEEKQEIRDKIKETAALLWAFDGKSKKAEKMIESSGAADNTNFITRGRVFYFGRPRDRASLGPMQLTRDAVVIKVEVTLQDRAKKKSYTVVGKGVSTKTAASALFTFHEERLELDKTNVGNATKAALEMAVAKLVKIYRKKYRR
ncbi:MAG: hypothetical protein GF398_17940 [Chitinivibrionales bacterium]|nr:hypothetical protein [Chitinivibrionales bacterium]